VSRSSAWAGVVEVDVVALEPLERLGHRGADVRPRQTLPVGLAAHLGGQHDVGPVAAGGEPVAEHGLRLAALVARREGRVGIGAVDEVAAGRHVGVEHVERLTLVGGPSEHVAAEAESEHVEV
jgi:hypothetical protein